MKKLLVGVVILATIIVGGFFFLNTSTAPQEEKVTDETSSWQTYRNEEFGFEVKHPEDWGVKHTVSLPFHNFSISNDRSSFYILPQGSPSPPYYFTESRTTTINIDGVPYSKREFLTEQGQPYFIDIHPVNWQEFIEQHEGLQWLIRIDPHDTMEFEAIDEVTQKAHGEVFDVDTLNQILSTFKFID